MSDPFLLEGRGDEGFLEWYYTNGSARISELSRQLRTSLNYKCAVIRLRFSKERKGNNAHKEDPTMTLGSELLSSSYRYVMLLKMIGVEDKTVTEKLLILMERVKAYKTEFERNLLGEIRQLGSNIWKIVHALSECEVHHHPTLLKMAIKIAHTLTNAENAFSWVTSHFYQELNLSYLQLEEELSGLLRKIEGMQPKEREKKRKVRILE